MIKLARIDDRLVHGQVAFTWVSSLGIDCLVVANDKVAHDDFQKMAMGLAKPPSVKLFILSLADAISFLNDIKSKNAKVLLLVNCIKDGFIMTNGVPEIKLFLLIFNIPHIVLRYNLTFIGYNAGNKFLQNLVKSNIMDRLTSGASILGLMVIGAMPAMLMSIRTPLNIGTSDSQVSVQSILDQLVPNMLPLALTLLVFYFVKRNVKTTWLLLGILALGFACSIIHVFA
jgi:hypothetical protein